jgi:hypothetical protein
MSIVALNQLTKPIHMYIKVEFAHTPAIPLYILNGHIIIAHICGV